MQSAENKTWSGPTICTGIITVAPPGNDNVFGNFFVRRGGKGNKDLLMTSCHKDMFAPYNKDMSADELYNLLEERYGPAMAQAISDNIRQ